MDQLANIILTIDKAHTVPDPWTVDQALIGGLN